MKIGGSSGVICLAVALLLPLGASGEELQEAESIVDKSRRLIEEMMLGADRNVPENLMRQAVGIALIPDMLKGGLIIGASYGKGVVLQRTPDGWAGPAFISISGGSVGIQAGWQAVDLILVVVSQEAMNAFLRNEFKIGADAGLAAGVEGVRVSAATDIRFAGGIHSYSRASGLFAGVSLEGAAIFSQEELNRAYYQETGSAAVILAGKVQPPESGQRLISALKKAR